MINIFRQDFVVFFENLKLWTNRQNWSEVCVTKLGKNILENNLVPEEQRELILTRINWNEQNIWAIGQKKYSAHHYIMSGYPTYAVGVPLTNVASNAFMYLVQLAIWVQVFVSISMGKRGWSTHRFDSADFLSRYDVDYCKFQ